MVYTISVNETEVRVAYLAVAGYLFFTICALLITLCCFKEQSGLSRLKNSQNAENYDASKFNADVTINMSNNNNDNTRHKMTAEMELADRFNLEMDNLDPERSGMNMTGDDTESAHNFDEFEEEDLHIDLANNPLSSSYNMQQMALAASKTKVNEDSTINLSNGNAVNLDDLPNLPSILDDDEMNANMASSMNFYQSSNASLQTLNVHAIGVLSHPAANNAYLPHKISQPSPVSVPDDSKFDNEEQVVISVSKKRSIKVYVDGEEADDGDERRQRNIIYKVCNKISMCTPIFFHFWDVTTDIAVLCDWIPDSNWNDPNSLHSPSNSALPNTFYLIIASILFQLVYRVVSGYRFAKRFNTCGGFLQFLDIWLFFEIYASINSDKLQSTLQLRWIRKMEAVLEAAPQALIQLMYVLSVNSSDDVPFTVQLSLLLSMLSITTSVVRSDEWKVREETGANQMWLPHWRFITRAIFRLFEITTRLCIVALLSQIEYGVFIVLFLIAVQIVFYLFMYQDGMLGNDVGNIIEILIAYPNMSLRLSDDTLNTMDVSWIGWTLRTLLCWNPIAGVMIAVKGCCCGGHSATRTDSTVCNACLYPNLPELHFAHRCVESFIELGIFVIGYSLDDSHDSISDLVTKPDIIRFMFIAAVTGSICTPFLYKISHRWFIEGADGIEMDVFGFLHHAHSEDDYNQFKRFVYRVRNAVNQTNKYSRTPLMEAIILKNYELCKFLLSLEQLDLSIKETPPLPLQTTNSGANGRQALHFIAELDDARFMKLILESPALASNPHVIDAVCGVHDKTALILCAESGHASSAKLLLQHKADVNYQDNLGRTCLHYAIYGESLSKATAQSARDRSHADYVMLIKTIVQFRPDLKLSDNKRKWPPLFQAVGCGSLEVVELLIKNGGAPLDGVDAKGENLLHVAVRYNRSHILKYLLTQTGGDHRRWNAQKNSKNQTPLKLAVICKHIECMKTLLLFGYSSLEEQKKPAMKALLAAVKLNAIDIVRILVRDFKVDPNFTGADGMTPLRWAAFNGFKDVCKQLLIGGARDDLDRFGSNIVFYAAKGNHVNVLQLLQKANADFCVVNVAGQSATDKTNDQQTVQFIQSVRNIQLQYH